MRKTVLAIFRLKIFFALIILNSGCEKDYLTINAFEAEGTTVLYEPDNTGKSLKVAVVSMKCSFSIEENVQKIIDYIKEIVDLEPSVNLISFGESITGWYAEDPQYIDQISESIPGPLTDTLSSYAKKSGIYLSFGMAESKGDRIYNSMVVINPEGEIIGKHRKNTLTPEDKKAGYSSYKNSNVIEIRGFNTGMMICADVNGEWLTNQYIDEGIDLVLSAFASPIGVPSFNIISRRMNAWQIFPNRYGTENDERYSGLIYVSDPAGNIVKYSSDKEGFITYKLLQ